MFTGFLGDDRRVQVPERFVSEVLPAITSLAELKVTLHVFLLLGYKTGKPRCVCWTELAQDETLARSLTSGRSPRPAQEWLREGLELAVARGTLLHLVVAPDIGPPELAESWYLANTRTNRRWVTSLDDKPLQPGESVLASAAWLEQVAAATAAARAGNGNGNGHGPLEPPIVRVRAQRASIYSLYEQNIGLLTPLLAEQLAEAERRYPPDWIEAAFTEAVDHNKRSWSYVRRILESWEQGGQPHASGKLGPRGRHPAGHLDPDKYLRGKYAHLFRRE
jgi:DnaD/phage-associated family protein